MQNSRSFDKLHGFKSCNFDFELYGRIIKAKNEQSAKQQESDNKPNLLISKTVTNESKR